MAGWYEIFEGEELLQGDFFRNCPIALPPKLLATADQAGRPDERIDIVPVKVRTYDVVIMSQSCDLVERKLNWVLVCPYWSITAMENADDEKVRNFFRQGKAKGKEEVRRGYVPGYHMLAASELENFRMEIQIVDFRTVFSLPFDFLTEFARARGERLRLLSPYREHLAQAFARFLMRVGLPADIPPFQ